MTNNAQLAQLVSDREKWNKWREEHPGEKIDFSSTILSDINLNNADLSKADLSYSILNETTLIEANLSGADLSGANLSHANLIKATLVEANLSGADLSYADLTKATLVEANLSGASLTSANFYKADLSGADLNSANLSSAHLDEANLSGADLNLANLSDADLTTANLFRTAFIDANLIRAKLIGADLSGAKLIEAKLIGADLSGANLRKTNLSGADLRIANLSKTDLRGANLSEANLSGANLSKTDLTGADLSKTSLIGTNFTGATLTDCNIYGISAWNVQLENATQKNLIITQDHEATITIDNLKVAQFIYLMLNNAEIRDVLDTIAKKAVLILGRFTDERKVVLDELREYLRTKDYLPILFDFQGPASQDVTGTVSTLAHISRFVIADLTDPSCSPYEIGLIAPCRKPITPIFQPTKKEPHEFAMLIDIRRRNPWVLPTRQYDSLENLLLSLQENIIDPAEEEFKKLEKENSKRM